MIEVSGISYMKDSREEQLPGWSSSFPYLCSHAVLEKNTVSWHWHNAIELFYMESGSLEYRTPHETIIFPEGSGGLVNVGIVHRSRLCECEHVEQFLHLFSPDLIDGPAGTLFYQRYIAPITECSSLEILPIFPDCEENKRTLRQLQDSFRLPESREDYPLQVRNTLSSIWSSLLRLPRPERDVFRNSENEMIKNMILFIQSNFSENLSVPDIARAAAVSERECYRIFRSVFHQTPSQYVRNYRLSHACALLESTDLSVGSISQECGFMTQQHFGSVFRDALGCTPGEYRKKHASDI